MRRPHHRPGDPVVDLMDVEQLQTEQVDAVEDAVQHRRVDADDAQPGHAVFDGDLEVLELLAQTLVHLAHDGDHERPGGSRAAHVIRGRRSRPARNRNAATRMCTLSTNTHAGKSSSSQGTKPAPNSRLTAVA